MRGCGSQVTVIEIQVGVFGASEGERVLPVNLQRLWNVRLKLAADSKLPFLLEMLNVYQNARISTAADCFSELHVL